MNNSPQIVLRYVAAIIGIVGGLSMFFAQTVNILPQLPLIAENFGSSFQSYSSCAACVSLEALTASTWIMWMLAGPIALVAAILAFAGKLRFAAVVLLISVLFADVIPPIFGLICQAIGGGQIHAQPYFPGFWTFGMDLDALTILSAWITYPMLVVAVISFANARSTPATSSLVTPTISGTQSLVAEATPVAAPSKGKKMAEGKQWEVVIPGAPDAKVDTATLTLWA
ncbi:MAG: hypothetical protein RLZZ319_198, partial [Actinomycetota bacterium]